MTNDPDELNYLRVMVAKKRKKNSFRFGPTGLLKNEA
jgi:hypothetical protein